jgi:hypothetical protein
MVPELLLQRSVARRRDVKAERGLLHEQIGKKGGDGEGGARRRLLRAISKKGGDAVKAGAALLLC